MGPAAVGKVPPLVETCGCGAGDTGQYMPEMSGPIRAWGESQ